MIFEEDGMLLPSETGNFAILTAARRLSSTNNVIHRAYLFRLNAR
jgi:hypothetical protein